MSTGNVDRIFRILLVPTLVSVALVLARFAYVWDTRFRFCGLLLNLALAWLPMLLSIWIWKTQKTRLFPLLLLVPWLLFFPNSFYITTDLIHDHKFGQDGVYFWYDILMTACFAITGIFLGVFSLSIVHDFIRLRLRPFASLVVVGCALLAASFGIYLGRFIRFNTWDVVARPSELLQSILSIVTNVHEVALFSGGFFILMALSYYLVRASMNLGRERPVSNSCKAET